MSGKEFPAHFKFPTPGDIPETLGCRPFSIPSDPVWFALLMGAVIPLGVEENWYAWGDLTPAEAAAAWQELIDAAYEGECGSGEAEFPTPFWDEVTDVEDSEPAETEPWYGYVTDPDADPAELTFVESAAIWGITGFIAYSGDVGAALYFNTIAPSFVLAWRAADVGEIIRVVVDAVDYAYIDTDGLEGELIELAIQPDEAESHDIYVIKTT